MKYALHNGILIPHTQALIPVEKKEVLFSFGVYESLKVRAGIPLFLEEHLERFFASARIMELEHNFPAEGIRRGLYDLIEQNGIDEASVRIQMYGGPDPFYYAFAADLPRYPEEYYREGVDTISYRGERILPMAKSNCLLLNYLAQREAGRVGALEALLLDREEGLLEGSRSNLFAVDGETIYTAGEGILHGVTRSHIIDYCSTGKLKMVYGTLRMQEVLGNRYEGIFISSTSMGAVPVRSLDGKRLDFDPSRWKQFINAVQALNCYLAERESQYMEKSLHDDNN